MTYHFVIDHIDNVPIKSVDFFVTLNIGGEKIRV